MVLPRFTRIPGLFTHCSHGLRVPNYRYVSQTSVRPARRRPRRPTALPTFPAPHSSSREQQQKSKNDDDDDDVKLNLFEQDGPGPGQQRRRAEHPDSEYGAFDQFDKELDRDMDAIGRELEGLEHSELDSEKLFKSLFTEEQWENIQQRAHTFAEHGESSLSTPHGIKVEEELTDGGKRLLSKLNEAIVTASLRTEDDKVRRWLWRYYERTKVYVPNLGAHIPDHVWDLLWKVASENVPSNPNRMAHIRVLTADMARAGRELTREQRYLQIESKFLEDERTEALSLWESSLQNGDAGNPEYLEMGIRMFSQSGNLKRAEEVLDALLKLFTTWNPRIIVPVLFNCIGLGTQEGFNKAFALYLRLRQRLSSDVTMDDYDRISGAFLRAGRKDYALSVFRDMILDGENESTELPYRTVMDRMGSFMSVAEDAKELNTMNLDSLIFLPRRFQNKFFYSSWMKRLIGMGQIDDAAQIVELMYERGVHPDAKHVNGVIGGWLRSGHKPAHQSGERMAWSMIQMRLNFVKERKQMRSGEDPPAKSIFESTEGAQLPALYDRSVPSATIETFSILVQWYLRREMFEHVRHLRNLLVHAEIPMNSYFMNHLLYAELRNRTHREVWVRFEVMSRTVTPDLETFWCLWGCMKEHVDPARNLDPSGFPNPRQLFARMRYWFENLTGQNLRDAREDVEVDLYHDIIQAFCLARDPEGSFAALQALKEMWGLHPEPETIRMLIMQIARLTAPVPQAFGKPSHRRARRITASQENKDNTDRAFKVLDMIIRARREETTARGVIFEDLDEKEQGDENHRAVLQLLYSVMIELRGDSYDGNAAIAEAARELGMESLDAEAAMELKV